MVSSLKQRKLGRVFSCFILVFIITGTLPSTMAFANTAEPPGLTVLVSNPPQDLKLSLRLPDGNGVEAIRSLYREQRGWDAYYRFYYGVEMPRSLEGAVLVVQYSGVSFECPLPDSLKNQYNNLITLDIKNQSITVGQPPFRQPLLISLRVVLTLLIEGLILFAFGYRQRASWIAFFAVNLLTQGALNVLLSGPELKLTYWAIAFILLEFVIFIVEMIAFALILKEHKKSRAVVFALSANLASLILGALLISFLPV